MKILVTDGTGMVGSHVVKELLKRDVEITVLTRKSKQEANLPDGVHHLRGDLKQPKTVSTMCKNMDAMFLLNVVSPTETHEGLMGVNAARMGSVKKMVYMSVHRVNEAPHLPHFGSKLPVETAIKASGIPYTILRPNNFYQNDYWYKDTMMNYGVYPQPIGNAGLSRVDVRDIAEAAAITLTTEKYQQNTFNLVGPEVQTGEGTARIWSKVLHKEIVYGGDNLNAWEKQSLEYMPDWMVFDFKLMYQFFQEEGLKATNEDLRKLTALLGHSPRSFEEFAEETADTWTKKASVKE